MRDRIRERGGSRLTLAILDYALLKKDLDQIAVLLRQQKKKELDAAKHKTIVIKDGPQAETNSLKEGPGGTLIMTQAGASKLGLEGTIVGQTAAWTPPIRTQGTKKPGTLSLGAQRVAPPPPGTQPIRDAIIIRDALDEMIRHRTASALTYRREVNMAARPDIAGASSRLYSPVDLRSGSDAKRIIDRGGLNQ